jgi:hypothetical protein
MTEEEFKALLKVRGDGYELTVNAKTVYEAYVAAPNGTVSMGRWASSEDKETALETLAAMFFGESDADTRE